jgi:hypothetical protein
MAPNVVWMSCDELPGDAWIRVRLPDGPGPFEVDCPGCGTAVMLGEEAVRSDAHQVG